MNLLSFILFYLLNKYANASACDMLSDKYHGSITTNLNEFELWPNGIVFYSISSSDFTPSQMNFMYEAMETIESQTKNFDSSKCIKFIKREKESNYIKIIDAQGCYSYVGKFVEKKAQLMSLNVNKCLTKKTIIHELMHALGFQHEQVRPDRDEWIQIHYDNILPNKQYLYKKVETKSYLNISTSYDYKSIMHFEPILEEHSVNKSLPVISALREPFSIKPSEILSEIDVLEIRKLYNCKQNPSTVQTWSDMNCFFSRKSYKSDRTIDSEKCMAKCIEHPKCTHYTWSPYNDNKCYIKDGKVSKSNATYLTSGWLKESLGGIYCGIVERITVTTTTIKTTPKNCDDDDGEIRRRCDSGECLDEKWFCDQTPDCSDGSDEAYCN